MILLKSPITGAPQAYLSFEGTTVQPRRTPVKPAYLLREHVSIAHSSAPSISKIERGQSAFSM
jgi:hypothetical protein